ncbi:MAG: cell division protein FtsZ [Patescibacteria group bacterium]
MEIKPEVESFAKIKVVGVGGGGGAAVDRMVKSKIKGVEFIAVNTDAQALHHNSAPVKVNIGRETCRGLGAGMDAEKGRAAAEESRDDLEKVLQGSDMVFITAGMGGGSGSGASPVIAEVAKGFGALTVAVVTKPFSFEGAQRRFIAEQALQDLLDKVDTVIVVPNDRLLQIIDKKTSLLDAFSVVDEVLKQGVQGISEIITLPGLINVDFADVRSIMSDAGTAMMGIGVGTGENRAVDAAQAAISSPLLEMSIDGAKGILFTITGGSDMSMYEVNEAAQVITKAADPNAKIIFGAVVDEDLGDEVKITVVATGFSGSSSGYNTTSQSTYPTSGITSSSSSGQSSSRDVDSDIPARPVKEEPKKPAPIPQKEAEDTKKDEEPLSPSRKYALPKIEKKSKDEKRKEQEEDDLEIPAFIRKKMG